MSSDFRKRKLSYGDRLSWNYMGLLTSSQYIIFPIQICEMGIMPPPIKYKDEMRQENRSPWPHCWHTSHLRNGR